MDGCRAKDPARAGHCRDGRAAADPPTAATAKPIPAKLAGGAGRKRQKMQKVNTIVLELECVLCGLVAAADLQLSGGPAGRVQLETNHWVRVYTGMSGYIGPHTLHIEYMLEYTLFHYCILT